MRVGPAGDPELDVSVAESSQQRPVSLVADDLHAESARPELATVGEIEGIKKSCPEYSTTRMSDT